MDYNKLAKELLEEARISSNLSDYHLIRVLRLAGGYSHEHRLQVWGMKLVTFVLASVAALSIFNISLAWYWKFQLLTIAPESLDAILDALKQIMG